MPFEARTKSEILDSLVALTVASGAGLTDLNTGSVLLTLLGSVAEELGYVEGELRLIRDSFSLNNISGARLDLRVADFPGNLIARKGASPSSGSVMQVTRGSSSADLTVPAGTQFRNPDTGVAYTTTGSFTIPAGQLVYPPTAATPYIGVISASTGVVGNCGAGTITQVLSAPEDIISCTNPGGISGGQQLETDFQLKKRAQRYMGSLARCQPTALEVFALQFTDSTGVSIKHAKIFESPTTPGYVELIVDDGTGMAGFTAVGPGVSGTVSATGSVTLNHAAPAVEPIAKIKYASGGTNYEALNNVVDDSGYAEQKWVSVEERGLVYINKSNLELPAGATWTIDNYAVYTGFIAELQRALEGSTTPTDAFVGYRAAGVRVKVRPPRIYDPGKIQINPILDLATNLDSIKEIIISETQQIFADLGPGEPFYRSKLIDRLLNIPGMTSVNIIKPTTDVLPTSGKYVVRPAAGMIEVV